MFFEDLKKAIVEAYEKNKDKSKDELILAISWAAYYQMPPDNTPWVTGPGA